MKIFGDYFWLIFIPTEEDLGDPFLLILCLLKIWRPILADCMPTEDLGYPFLLLLCFMPTNRKIIRSCFIPISKNYRSCYVPKSIVLVSLQFPKCIILAMFQKASLLFCSEIDSSFLASLYFV